jgi:hypothetical protein
MNGHTQSGINATSPTEEEYLEWLADEQAQEEYREWLDYINRGIEIEAE